MNKNIEYYVTGLSRKTGNYSLVCICGGPDLEHAESVLEKVKNDKSYQEKFSEFKLAEIASEEAWWNEDVL